MKIKWQWFLGGRIMFWTATVLLVVLTIAYTLTYVIDPITGIYMSIQRIDNTSIKALSEQYVSQLGITISKPIIYRFVKYKHEHKGTALLGTFHEWNNKYYIDISVNLFGMGQLYDTVIHETRHMIVQELKNRKIIDLSEYTETIAQEEDTMFDKLFDYSVKLLKKEQCNGK